MKPINTGAALLLSAFLAASAGTALAGDIRVTTLGTGSPVPSPDRFSQSTLVEVNGQTLLFDMGRGVTIRLAQSGLRLGAVDAHFITHFHSDHLDGLTDLWGTGWLATPFGGRDQPMRVFGPEGTRAMTDHLTEAFRRDIEIRLADEGLPPSGIAFDVTEIGPGPVYSQDDVNVSAFAVHHGDLITPAFGYRIEHDGKTVVISGDTTFDPAVIEAARGADLLIHEVADIGPRMLEAFPSAIAIADHHSLPEQAGEVFAAAEPVVAAFSHIIVAELGTDLIAPLDTTGIVEKARQAYSGPLVVADDLTSFVISDAAVTAITPDGSEILRADR